MLQHLSERIRECLAYADEARKRADAAADPEEKIQFLETESRWLLLARNYEFSESLEDFTAYTAQWHQNFEAACRESDRGVRERHDELRWLASIVASSDDAIISKDIRGNVMSWNKGAERIFGYVAEEVIGKCMPILIPLDRHDEETRILERIKAGEKIEHFETVRQRKDGSLVEISLCVSLMRDERGAVIGVSRIARDITQRKKIGRQAAVLAREAEHRAGAGRDGA